MIIFIASVLVALFISALCSLFEAAVLSLTPSQVANLSSRQPKVGAIWQNFKTHIERPIAVILILNTAAHTIGATIAGAQFELLFGEQGIFLFSLILTYFMLQFTEILPKTLGVRFNNRLAPVIAYPLTFLIRLFRPLISFIHLINKPFAPKQVSSQSPATLEEISALAGLARLSNLINPQQERIIQGAFRLSEKRVHQVMIPVEQVTFLSASQSLTDAIIIAHLDPHTRFPICESEDRNRVLGYVNFKEIIYHARTNPADRSLCGIIRPVHFVAPEESAAELLKVFVERHEHIAIVRGKDGKTLGLVTLEDVIEELVGELEDEFDRLPRLFHQFSGGTWMVGGGVPAEEVASKLGLALPDAQGTISAWLIRQFGRVPQVNEIHQIGGTEFMIRRTRRGKIFEVAVTHSSGRRGGEREPARHALIQPLGQTASLHENGARSRNIKA
jgi:CBS domain containing-hemolysin-like protein